MIGIPRSCRLAVIDYAAIMLSVSLIVLFAVVAGGQGEATRVEIEAQAGSFIYPLSEDRTLIFEGPLGQSLVEIRDGRVRVAEDPGPLQICVRQGWIEAGGEWLACLPSQLFLRITGVPDTDDVDARTF